PFGIDMNRALTDAHGDDHLRACTDQPLRFAHEVRYHFLAMRGQVGQIETADTKPNDSLFHAVAAHDRAIKREQFFMIDDQTESIAEQSRDMQTSFHRRDHRNIYGRSAAVHTQIEHAQRHHGIVTFLFCAAIGVDERGRDELNLGWRYTVKIWRRLDTDDSDFDF